MRYVVYCNLTHYIVDITIKYSVKVIDTTPNYLFIMNDLADELKDLDTQIVTLRVKKRIVALIDKERAKYSTPRSSWFTQAAVEKLERLGHEIN